MDRKLYWSLTNLMVSRNPLSAIFCIHFATSTSRVGTDARTASGLSVSRALRNSTTTALFRLLISKTSSNCRTSRLNRSVSSFPNTQTKQGSPLSVRSSHLSTSRQRDNRCLSDEGVAFNLYNELISELVTFGVIAEGTDGLCEIINPVYHYCILQAFKPAVNGLEQDYFPADTRAGFQDYLTPNGQLHMDALLDNFRDFIARAGFRILQVPETPQEYIGQYLCLS